MISVLGLLEIECLGPQSYKCSKQAKNAGSGYKIQNLACGPNMSSNGAQEQHE